MNFSADMSTTLNRILDTAADNLRVAKILIQLGLDPNNVTYDAIFNRLLEIFLANITLANMFALIGAIFFVATLLTQTMVPLRVANMVGCIFFAGFGALAGDVKTLLLYLLLVPINAFRLRQMLNLVKMARSATQGDTSMEWLKPFMTERRYRKGDVLFKRDDAAHEMFLTVTGKFLVKEINVELPPGRLMGELGFLSPNNRRTATVECLENGLVLTITYEKLLEIYFQNPQFGYYFLVLTSQRLLENLSGYLSPWMDASNKEKFPQFVCQLATALRQNHLQCKRRQDGVRVSKTTYSSLHGGCYAFCSWSIGRAVGPVLRCRPSRDRLARRCDVQVWQRVLRQSGLCFRRRRSRSALGHLRKRALNLKTQWSDSNIRISLRRALLPKTTSKYGFLVPLSI
jgi:hypothetical protein